MLVRILGPLACIVAASAPAQAIDRVTTEIEATVSDDLDRVHVIVRTEYIPAERTSTVTVILAADRYRQVPEGMRPSDERFLFPRGYSLGGFESVVVRVRGVPCEGRPSALPERGRTAIDGQPRALVCPVEAGPEAPVSIQAEADLIVPEMYGPFGRHRRQLTLAGGWYPYVARPGFPAPRGPHRIKLRIPSELGAVVGGAYFAPSGGRALPERTIEAVEDDASMIPLVVLAPTAGAEPAAEGHVRFIGSNARQLHDPNARTPEQAQVLLSIEDGLRFWDDLRLPLPPRSRPALIVEAPLRHDLAFSAEGLTLVSDRAFRMSPVERFYRFHRFPLLRELFGTLLRERLRRTDGPRATASADAVAASLVDRYVTSRFGAAESAFDVLDFWSFIPSVDLLLYAPDLPFEGAYFRRIKEDDPLRPNLVDFPLELSRGKIVYEKLLDRVGRARAGGVLEQVLRGARLEAALASALGGEEARAFLRTWLGPYPEVRYRLLAWSSRPGSRDECGGPARCERAEVAIAREGDPIAEPLEVLLRDKDGKERRVWTEATTKAVRVLTATLAAPLDLVEIDPHGRVHETPSEDTPSPRLDNRSSARWKVLLNNWNISLAATAGTIDSAIDVGFLRVYDVHWSYALRADYTPAAIALSGRVVRSFGRLVNPAELAQHVGLTVAGEYLRPKFANATQDAFAVSAALSYGFDTRQTVWAPEGGQGFRLTLEQNHVFGQLVEQAPSGARALSEDALRLTARAFQSWRLGGAHTLSIRGSAGSYLFGTPRSQLLYAVGGRSNVRGYPIDAVLGRARAIASAEWVHHLIPELDENALFFAWASGLDGTLYADLAVAGADLPALTSAPLLSDVGYGLRVSIDYFGVRPGVMSVDIAVPLSDARGRGRIGSPAVYIDFVQSF